MVAALLHDIGKGEPHRAQRRRGADRPEIATRMGFDERGGRPGRARWCAGTCCSPRPRPPATPTTPRRSRCVAARLGRRGGARPAPRAHRGRRPRHLAQGLVVVAGRTDPRPGPAAPAAALASGAVAAAGRPTTRSPCPRRYAAARSRSRVEPVGRRRAGHRDRARPGRAARRRRRDVRAAARLGPGRAGWSQDDVGVSVWEVAEEHSTRPCCASATRRSWTGRLDPAPRLAPPAEPGPLAPTVVVRPEASAQRDRARGAHRRPARRGPPGLRSAGRARRRGPLGARRHPRPPGRRRVLPPGGRSRRRSPTSAPPRPRTPSATPSPDSP